MTLMKNFQFLVQGSTQEPYQTKFNFDGKNLTAFCTCAAGANGQFCKHRTEILHGNSTSIVSNNKNEISELLTLAKETPLYFKMLQLDSELIQLEQLKKKVEQSKKEFAKIMTNQQSNKDKSTKHIQSFD